MPSLLSMPRNMSTLLCIECGQTQGPEQPSSLLILYVSSCYMHPAQEFLEANNLRLILRSHEGPDARCDRDNLPDMKQGFTIDHVTPAGRLLTVFSAPDYPQFQVTIVVLVPHSCPFV